MNITQCQCCGGTDLEPVFSAGFIPMVNSMETVGAPLSPWIKEPARLLRCSSCTLVQLEWVEEPDTVFPRDYSYRSGTTKLLRDNFSDLAHEVVEVIGHTPGPKDLVLDIASNDGTLLKQFRGLYGCKIQGVEPTDAYKDALKDGIPTINEFWSEHTPGKIIAWCGQAKIVTACNVFAHVPDPYGFLKAVDKVLTPDGVFVVECHYLPEMLRTVQYDTVYHEHLRHYSLVSLNALLEQGGFKITHARKIPTHGGSIRVYASRKDDPRPPTISVVELLGHEGFEEPSSPTAWETFRQRVTEHKLALWRMLDTVIRYDGRVYGVGCPSRAVTLINYCGLDESVLPCVCEVPGSPKIDHYVPGTLIPVVDEKKLFEDQPDFALLLSWHLADELAPKLRTKGFKGRFICPLPEPRILG